MTNDKFFKILPITFKSISCLIISSISFSLFITIYQYLFHGLSISYFIIYLPFISLFYLIFCVPLQLIFYNKATKYNLKYLSIYIIISAIVNILIIDAAFRNKFELILTIIVSSLIYWFFDSLLLRNKK
ncbi:UPF0715 family protein [Bacillus pumilus]|uniref:UPF0715 family protein n=1 Tax=Bacillus pumilus TaxID=1408 RepID=UPI00398FCE73